MQRLQASSGFVVAAFLLAAMAGVAATSVAAEPARAEECPGNPDALGTSRLLVVHPGALTRVGLMQYRQTLPLADKEVVLTFDDGPQRRYSSQILDILATQCVKATYFLIGNMARAHPDVVRRIHEEGHTIGTHTENHPARILKLPVDKVREEIDDGIADVAAALGDQSKLAPFFRIPGLERSDMVEEELAARSLVVFSADTVADDWFHGIKPKEIVHRAMSRLQARGKGILLLHDIHPATVAALPELLSTLKREGFRIVHLVPEAAEPIEIADGPIMNASALATARLHDLSTPIWPEVMAARPDDRIVLPAPDAMAFAANYRPGHRMVGANGSAGAGYFALSAAWANASGRQETALSASKVELPAPDIRDIGLPLLGLEAPNGTPRLSANFAAAKPGAALAMH